MINCTQLLTEKIDEIVERWVKAVCHCRQIERAEELDHTAVRDHIPCVLAAMATVLSQPHDSDIRTIAEASLDHGTLRAEQGFDPTAIAQEYHLLRREIFAALEPELLKGSPAEVIRVFCRVDAVVDEAITQCFKSYVNQRLSELEKLESHLRLTNQELNRLIQANQENFSQLAHEFKTPLTSIIGYSELFLRSSRQNPDLTDTFPSIENIERVLRNGRQLLHLVNDALELSRCEAGKMQLRLASTDVSSVINGVIEVMQPLVGAKELEIVIDCDRAPERVLTDYLRLQQIVMNLISNAIRYTDAGSVQVTCQMLSNEQWALTISDTGRGIALEDQARIFDPYFRVGSGNQSYQPNSTGLGLAIVSRLVTLLQGKIELVSHVGVGSTFTVTLPLEIRPLQSALTASTVQSG